MTFLPATTSRAVVIPNAPALNARTVRIRDSTRSIYISSAEHVNGTGSALSVDRFSPYSKQDQLGRGPKKNAKKEPDRKALSRRSKDRCEVRAKGCTGKAAHVHHVLRRPHVKPGEDDTGIDLLLHTCFQCHDHIHNHVRESYKMGWLKRSGK